MNNLFSINNNNIFYNIINKKKTKNNKKKMNKETMEKRIKILLVKKTIYLNSHPKKITIKQITKNQKENKSVKNE